MEPTVNKQRTPSKCREWERQRRNKFNDAISKLGEIVKAINKANSNSGENDADNIQYPKIEIVQKAIICLTNYVQEKTQLKAEILALEVKLEGIKKNDTKDVSVQVSFGINKKNQNGKYMKILKLQKSKQKTKDITTKNVLAETKTDKSVPITPLQDKCAPKLPKLLPLASNNKKGPENTLVMLPATPYIFPQRPLLFPTVPPTIVLVDTNLQPINKASPIPIINRSSTDITKTTMVNILPISAYSRPLSATKSKKNNSKPKNTSKKAKKIKPEEKLNKTSPLDVKISKEHSKEECIKDNIIKQRNDEKENKTDSTSSKNNDLISQEKSALTESIVTVSIENKVKKNDVNIDASLSNNNIDLKTASTSKTSENPVIIEKICPTSAEKSINIKSNTVPPIKINKNTDDKVTSIDEKSKDAKLPNILDATICENVDGGNARLELAEELLAASPTAAFLMSFPLVSGNRADSPADDTQNAAPSNPKENNLRRNDVAPQTVPYFEKPNPLNSKVKSPIKNSNPAIAINKSDQQKYINHNVASKESEAKTSNLVVVTSGSTENPFLNLPMTSLISTSCPLTDSSFGMEFDCNINKTSANQPASYVNSTNIFYKGDPFNTVKNTIYSTSSISSGHDFNSLGLYPCAMEKYSTKSKPDFSNVEDNIMKIGSSRLTYDIDLGWSHKGFDFVNCTTSSTTFTKDNILTSSATSYSTSYNPFNPDFHVPLVSTTNKKDHGNKPTTSFSESISSLYSQTTNLWTDDVPTYNNPNFSKNYTPKQNYHADIQSQTNVVTKTSLAKQYEIKHATDNNLGAIAKPSSISGPHQMPDTKKSPNKMHINWMTSEIRPLQNNCNQSQAEIKNNHKLSYSQVNHSTKKQDHSDSNYFPINMHNYQTQANQEEFQVWPTARPAGTTEISIDPPPINLPTLVGDLALGPHDKKKTETIGPRLAQAELPNCSSFLSVTQLMNRSNDNMSSRYYGSNIETPKPFPTKQNLANVNDLHRKGMSSRLETNLQPNYVLNDPKQSIGNYENIAQFSQPKSKPNKSDKSTKVQKNNYSAEALIRGGTCSQKTIDNSSMKFMTSSQKYNDFNLTQDSSVAQVSHFPPIIDYSDNNYSGQQFSGTTLYNSTTNTISNSFYTNFMPGGTNLMGGNYTSGPFTTDFIDYNQTAECTYANHKYEELKIKNNSNIFQQDKLTTSYKSTRRESAAKHKLECSKKDSSKKYQSKRAKLTNEVEEWSDSSHLLWQNKTPAKRHSNLISEEITFPNYVGNQMPTQYQADFFNSHLMSSNMQNMGHHNVATSLASFPVTSRANFNLSTIFPEITMKVQ